MAEAPNDTMPPALNDVEMKEETAETPVHSIPSAPNQVPEVSADQATGGSADRTAALPINQLPTEQPTAGAQADLTMEGIIDGQSAAAPPTAQTAPPPVAQPPSASSLPATAAAPPVPPVVPVPTSAPPTRPSSIPPAVSLPPERPHPHGSSTRVYINQTVTPHLLEGMKHLAAFEPEKPLKWLSEFLAKRSAEVEGES